MSNTMQDAFKKAGIHAEDFVKNEKLKFTKFPIITKWRDILPESGEMEKFKYKQGLRSAAMQSWMDLQDQDIISFLKRNKDNVYILPANKCQKYCECWIGYSYIHQQFTMRMNRLAYNIHPWGSVLANNYATNFARVAYDACNLESVSEEALRSISFSIMITKLFGTGRMPEAILKTFSPEMIIPVEYFDPIVEINYMVYRNMAIIESTDMDVIMKELTKMKCLLKPTRLHKNTVKLYCSFNNIKPQDPYNVLDKTNWLSLVFAKDVNGSGKEDKSFFIVM